eukprot:evm.model.scf_774EXC.2 EVM.evm.TU.scf_774EXC.2   scf_774EXC:30261-42288(-)
MPSDIANASESSSREMSVSQSISTVLLGSKLNILLIFLPIAIALKIVEVYSGGNGATYDAVVFVVSLLALCPLAERLGFITEELAAYTNDTIGGLLNATFGNATEVIISGFALAQAKDNPTFLRVVQLSLLGSVLSNLLLVLGTAFFIGGIVHRSQSFSQEGMTVNSGLLLMAVSAILLPSTLKATGTGTEESPSNYGPSSELYLSRFESLFLLACYGFYLVFQLCTHRHLFEGDEAEVEGDLEAQGTAGQHNTTRQAAQQTNTAGAPLLGAIRERNATRKSTEDEVHTNFGAPHLLRKQTLFHSVEESQDQPEPPSEQHTPTLGRGGALVWLSIVTVLIALISEFVVSSIEGAADGLKIPLPFLSTIVLPIVGNAAEHASAILFAYKNRMEITLGVAVGSSTQIAVLVIPFCVILSWIMGEDLDLNFETFESIALFLSVLIVIVAMNDGSSNWLKGIMLCMTFVFVSAAFWVHFDDELTPKPEAAPKHPGSLGEL